MGVAHPALTDAHVGWIARQHMFFVATAPSGAEGHVNLSPKGHDTFRVIDPSTVAYLDLTGSGVETIAHLRENGRITIMFCSFTGKPQILRLYGTGTVLLAGDDGFDAAAAAFDDLPGRRAVITVAVERVSSSCGYSIPLMAYEGERETLIDWAERRGPDGVEAYWNKKNGASIDGLPAIPTR